jgi:Zn-dependent M28 family amino/carboxypeptidase
MRPATAFALSALSGFGVWAAGCEPPPPDPSVPLLPREVVTADSARILESLAYLSSDALQGRLTGTDGAALARVHLAAEWRDAGVEPVSGVFERPFTRTSAAGDGADGVNLVGVVHGTEISDRYIVLSAHYDHVGVRNGQVFNGADDNASGAVALGAIARALRDHPLRHSLILAALDAEESGLRGARAFVADPPVPLGSIELNVNLDMIARTDGLLWAAGAAFTPVLAPVLEQVAATAPVELRLGHDRADAPEGDDWTRSSDHGAFHSAGIPFVYFGVEDHEDYHRPTDDFERVDRTEYLDAIQTVLAALISLDAALPLQQDDSP